MSEHPGDQPPPDAGDRREPDDSPARRLVQSVQAYEVDPPPPVRDAPDRSQEPRGPISEE